MKTKESKRSEERDGRRNGSSRGDGQEESRGDRKAAKGDPERKKVKKSSQGKTVAKEKEGAEKPARSQASTKAPKEGRKVVKRKAADQDRADKAAEPKRVRTSDEDKAKEPKRVRGSDEDKAAAPEKAEERSKKRGGPVAAVALDDADGGAARGDVERSSVSCGRSSSGSLSSSALGRRRRQRERESARGASGFSAAWGAAQPPQGFDTGPDPALGGVTFGPAPGEGALVPIPGTLRGLLDNRQNLAQEMARMKSAMEASQKARRGGSGKEDKSTTEANETVLRMPPRLHESLLHPDNEAQLLARTGLASATLNEDGLVVLRAHSPKGLSKVLGQLRRVAFHCQWGCNKEKVAGLLAGPPARPAHTMVVRLAATASRLQSFEIRLNKKQGKLRIGTQAGACQMVIEGIPGLSRKHCTITFEPEKGACYVQDLSTNGTYFNGKRLPRPPYKKPQDARVRVFHGDELFFRLREKESEELGYVINLLELN